MLVWALFLLLHSVLSFSLHEIPPMEVETDAQSKEVEELIQHGQSDRTTEVTFTVKAYITPEVAATYPNASESIEYLKDILKNNIREA